MTISDADYQKELAWETEARAFNNKRVEITYSNRHDFTKTAGTKRGWLLDRDGKIYLLPRANALRAFRLTGGMFDGFSSTLTVTSIKPI